MLRGSPCTETSARCSRGWRPTALIAVGPLPTVLAPQSGHHRHRSSSWYLGTFRLSAFPPLRHSYTFQWHNASMLAYHFFSNRMPISSHLCVEHSLKRCHAGVALLHAHLPLSQSHKVFGRVHHRLPRVHSTILSVLNALKFGHLCKTGKKSTLPSRQPPE